jgi:hypothetical protein
VSALIGSPSWLLRRVTGKCSGCGRELVTWFHVQAVLPN